MIIHVYISADYDPADGDQEVVDTLVTWGKDEKHKTEFIDTAKVASGSVADEEDCRPCDLKNEFNHQINASSVVIIVVGNKTKDRISGSGCARNTKAQSECNCTPYKHNSGGIQKCKVKATVAVGPNDDYGCINPVSYLRHEFEQAKKKEKKIIVVYNSLYRMSEWLPDYLQNYESVAEPFWIKNEYGNKVGNYQYIKKALGYE